MSSALTELDEIADVVVADERRARRRRARRAGRVLAVFAWDWRTGELRLLSGSVDDL